MIAPLRSLQARLLMLVLSVVMLVWAAAAIFVWREVRHETDELLDAHLAQAAALLVVQHAQDFEHDDERTLDAPTLHRYARRAVFQVFHQGQPVVRSADAPRAPLLPLQDVGGDGIANTRVDGVTWRVFAARGDNADMRVFVAERADSRSGIVWAALRGTLAPLALALPLLGLLVWWAVFRGMWPLRSLQRELALRAPQSLAPLQLSGAPTEITPVVEALNTLFARIAELLEGERRFTADAAHELRTPIAAIRAQAQVALGATNGAARHQALEATLQGCDRATRLIDQLLTLARVEAGAGVKRTSVDLSALARQLVVELAPRALDRSQDLGLDAPAVCTIAGDVTLLAVLLRNLVDNALRYSPPGSQVAVAVRHEGGRTVLTVDDSGPGLPEEEHAQLGRRFHRAAGQQATGSGLGWSIVRRIAAVLGLEVSTGRSSGLGGLAVRVSGPAA